MFKLNPPFSGLLQNQFVPRLQTENEIPCNHSSVSTGKDFKKDFAE